MLMVVTPSPMTRESHFLLYWKLGFRHLLLPSQGEPAAATGHGASNEKASALPTVHGSWAILHPDREAKQSGATGGGGQHA
jgi:hypothetical protein